MKCPQCPDGELYQSSEDKERAVSFSIFALVLVGIGAALHLFHVAMWPWWLYGIGGFVFFQGALKWFSSTNRYCPKCYYRTTVWPWTRV